jgi:hypothetical protein
MPEETTFRDYWMAVKSIAQESIDESKEYEEELWDTIWSQVDSSWWMTYTHASLAVLQHTDHPDALFEEMGSDALAGVDSFSEAISRMAFYALLTDVQERAADLTKEAD